MWIFTQVWIDLVYSVFRTFTEDKALTAAACYSLCSFFVYLQIHNFKIMKNYVVVFYSLDSFLCVFTSTQFGNNEKLLCFFIQWIVFFAY